MTEIHPYAKQMLKRGSNSHHSLWRLKKEISKGRWVQDCSELLKTLLEVVHQVWEQYG